MKRLDELSVTKAWALWSLLMLLGVAAVFLSATTVIADDDSNSWRVVADKDMDKAQKKQKQAAKNAQAEMASRFVGKLLAAMGKEGTAGAINVCKSEAPKIATDVGRKHSLKIGRTSFKLRNAANTPPKWATQAVSRKVADVTHFASGDGRLGVLTPIRLQPLCLSCHGPKDQLADPVKKALAKAYPNDQATGFKSGDLRGWFWAEVKAVGGVTDKENLAGQSDAAASRGHATQHHHQGRGPGRGQGPMRAHEAITFLLKHHKKIQREVKPIEGGVQTVTTSKDPAVVSQIRKHVQQMKQRLESGHGMRHFDPLFRELFKHYDKISMTIENVDGGVRVIETSTDKNAVLLIRKHAESVTAFIKEGATRAAKPSSLPEGYKKPSK